MEATGLETSIGELLPHVMQDSTRSPRCHLGPWDEGMKNRVCEKRVKALEHGHRPLWPWCPWERTSGREAGEGLSSDLQIRTSVGLTGLGDPGSWSLKRGTRVHPWSPQGARATKAQGFSQYKHIWAPGESQGRTERLGSQGPIMTPVASECWIENGLDGS